MTVSPADITDRDTLAGRGFRFERIMPPGMVPLASYFAFLLIGPLTLLVLYSFWKADFFAVDRTFNLGNYARLLTSPLYSQVLLKTLQFSCLAALICVVVGYAISYAIVFRLKKLGPVILTLIMMSLLASYIVRLYAMTTILGTNGLVNQALIALGLIEEPLTFLLYGYFAIVITLVYVYLPFAVLPIYAGLQGIDRRLLEASRDLGSSPVGTFFRVTLPLSMRGVRLAFAFCYILAAADYVAPRIVGGMDGQMIGSIIANQFGGASDYPFGAALAVSMIIGFAAALVILLAAEWLLARVAPTMGGMIRRNAGGRRFRMPDLPICEAVTAVALVFLFAPLITVIVFSFNNTPNPGLPFAGVTGKWYAEVVQRGDFLRVLRTSLLVCISSVLGALAIGVPAAIALARRQFILKLPLEMLVYGPMAVPGVVLGVALLATFVALDIRLGVATTILAHILLLAPFIVLVVRTRLEKVDPRVEEAGRDLGSRPLRVFRTVTLPMLTPSLLGAGLLASAISLDDLLVTNFTIGANATVPVWIASQMRVGLTPALNAVSVLMLLGTLGLIALAAFVISFRRSLRLSNTFVGS